MQNMRAKKAEIKAERQRSGNDSDTMSGFDSEAVECTVGTVSLPNPTKPGTKSIRLALKRLNPHLK